MLRRNSRFAKSDAQRVDFRVVTDFHLRIKNSRCKRLRQLLPQLLRRRQDEPASSHSSAVPFLVVSVIFSAFEASKLSQLPTRGANGVFHFINSETAFGRVPQRVIGNADRFHSYHQRQMEEEPQGFRRSQTMATRSAMALSAIRTLKSIAESSLSLPQSDVPAQLRHLSSRVPTRLPAQRYPVQCSWQTTRQSAGPFHVRSNLR